MAKEKKSSLALPLIAGASALALAGLYASRGKLRPFLKRAAKAPYSPYFTAPAAGAGAAAIASKAKKVRKPVGDVEKYMAANGGIMFRKIRGKIVPIRYKGNK